MRHVPPRRPSALRAASVPTRPAPVLTDDDRRAILSVCDTLIGSAGRTTLAMALRGSRAKRVWQHRVDRARGYGHFAGVPEADVLARIDALIAERTLRIEHHDGFPLLGYTESGLALAMRFAAEAWLDGLRTRVQPVAVGAAPELPFLRAAMPDRNQNTVLLLADLVAREANASWLPLLRSWAAAETRRVRARLTLIVDALERLPR